MKSILRRPAISAELVASLLIAGVGVVAATSLWVLRRDYNRSVHDAAARAVLDMGGLIAGHLAGQPALRAGRAGRAEWDQFAQVVRSMYKLEHALQYVSVTDAAKGTVLFSEHRTRLGEAQSEPPAPEPPAGPVSRKAQLLSLGEGRLVPVITFTVKTAAADGSARVLQVAIRSDAVGRQEAEPVRALGLMFRTALATIAVSFGACALLVVWLTHRETTGRRRRSAEEHLAFAGALADGIIHDVRNPMSSLRLDVQMLGKEAARGRDTRPERLAELAERAGRTMERMDTVLGEFLYMSRPGSAEAGSVDVNACLRDSVDLLKTAFERSQVHLACDLSSAPLPIRGHAVELKRAFVNVLTNARQASPANGRVSLRSAAEGAQAVVTVSDQGPGVPRRQRRRIFDLFYSTRPEGTGLGLTLTRAAVEHNGGIITVSDAPGGGACFSIRLPLARDRDGGAA